MGKIEKNKKKAKSPDALKNAGYREQYGVIVICDGESQQKQAYRKLFKAGYKCRVVVT